jgi:GTP-binding protein
MPGTTRDRVFAEVSWRGDEFTIVDTGGLEISPHSTVGRGVREQVDMAVDEADAIIFMVDVRDGVTVPDREAADLVRRSRKPVVIAANKADNERLEGHAVEFHELGLGEPLPISAHHARGTADLLDRIMPLIPPPPVEPAVDKMLKVAIVGRPNVGKSMLLNSILGSERVIVDDTPGTTRDAIDMELDLDGQSVLLIDTAGMRRRGKLGSGIERYSVMRALRAIDRADVALLVLDATEGSTAQDTHVAGYVQQAAKGIVLIVNKWDLVDNDNRSDWDSYLRSQYRFVSYAPLLYTSAKLGSGVAAVLPKANEVYRERQKRLPTSQVNRIVLDAVAAHGPARNGRHQLKVFYATQSNVNPPTFVFFVNDSRLVHFSYRRYLENKLRRAFGFEGTPLRMVFKSRSEE